MISPSLLDFLQELAQNNERGWFQAHKNEHKSLNKAFTDYMLTIAEQIAHFDPAIQNRMGDPKLVKVFRIYRDTRFSKDKTPYKINFSGAIAASSAAGQPVYYLSIEPGNSFAGGGVYMPPTEYLQAIREKIDEDYKALEKILNDKAFKAIFPNGLDRHAALKTAPRGYSTDHPAIDLLRLKSFVAGRNFSDAEVTSKPFTDTLLETYEALSKLNAYFQD
ncbi:MAG: DUF2461 domain-containing protein [Cyanobacteria bacterium P01_A01_bin.123]